jgi:3-dehydroquinate synthase
VKIVVKPGEASKSLNTASRIYDTLIRSEVDRNSFLLGIGGGIVCDLAGFIASTYMRGLPFGFVSTTLLSQVDASIGGKNGLNFKGYKNMIGVICQPDFVLCDPEMLKTLEPKEFRAGFAEVIKYERNHTLALGGQTGILEEIVAVCAEAKCAVVSEDEKESGKRRILNFGHTFAHAFEKLGRIPHGEAVSIGMVIAAGFSRRLGMISPEKVERLRELLLAFGLPVHYEGSLAKAFDAMKRDKKRGGDSIHMVLLKELGTAFIQKVPLTEMKIWIDDLC